ncbi:MAG: molybdopterin-guanine dinucleotide biosynthesis protein B [Chloroflexi bacterium]|nr:molybdopterin-guanine dinucleotide biosynthesis protein B [Chloroflexota bacterium]
MPPIISIVGKSNVGKTTFLVKLLPELKKRGYRVATVKHDVHGFEMDRPGKDSWRHAQAGSDVVVVSSPEKLAMIRPTDHDWTLPEIGHLIGDSVDIIITEGFKREEAPKIEIHRKEVSSELLCTARELVALVTDEQLGIAAPQFGLDDAAGVAGVLEKRFLAGARTESEVTLVTDGKPIALAPFVRDAIVGTLVGLLSTLKGMGSLRTIDLRIKREG